MKQTALKATLLAAMTGLSAGAAGAADYRKNPFSLAYEGAITKNEPGKVQIHPVTYKLNGLDIVANVYTPSNYDPGQKYPTIVMAHPNGGVKEQVAGLYAQHLAELFKIDGATHIETYWVPKYVDAAMNKLTPFYGRTL